MMVIDPRQRWVLVQVKPNADRIARRNLERQEFLTFQPLERRTRVHRGRFTTELRPFFPGYLFLSHREALAPWSLVNSTLGVTRLVSFSGKPAPVPVAVIRELQSACDGEDVISLAPELETGTKVTVAEGTFSGFLGQIERVSPDLRALVLLDFMGKETRVTIPASQLRLAEAEARSTAGISI